jgi:hypothetical protein
VEKKAFAKFARIIILLAVFHGAAVDLLQAQENEDDGFLYSPRSEPTKITLGVVEDVVVSPWGLSFPARIDTGADLSSLDARDLVVRNNVAEFKLGKRWGGRRVQLPVTEWRHIQTAMGIEKRPVVEISICLGSKHFPTLVTLKDRSEMMYPFLVGRSALKGGYVVDASRSRAARPLCPSLSSGAKQFAAAAND